MKKLSFYTFLCIAPCCLLLNACSKHEGSAQKEVANLVKVVETSAEATQKNEQNTETPVVKPYRFDGDQLRDPFEGPTESKEQSKQYANTILKNTALDSLKLIGVVLNGATQYAIFRANDGQLYKIGVGTRVGLENSLLKRIDENQVEFIQETGPTSEGTLTREIVVRLQEPKS